MDKPKVKMYLVKREVYATSVEAAIHKPGKVYEVQLAEEKSWPEEKEKKIKADANPIINCWNFPKPVLCATDVQ